MAMNRRYTKGIELIMKIVISAETKVMVTALNPSDPCQGMTYKVS
jgi:hypothetical protein